MSRMCCDRPLQLCFFAMALCLGLEPASGQPRIQQSPGNQEFRRISTIQDLYKVADTPGAGAGLDFGGFRTVLKSLDSDARSATLKRLILSGNLDLASSAAHEAIEARDERLAGPIASRICSWRSLGQASILDRIGPVRGAFLEAARAVARCGANARNDSAVPGDPVGVASILLARTGIVSDRQLIADLSRLHPRSAEIWTAIGYAGIAGKDLMASASRVYRDGTLPMATRIAAATALQSVDDNASRFALGEIQSYLAQYGDSDLSMLTAAALDPHADQSGRTASGSVVFSTGVIGSLFLLNVSGAEDLTFQYLEARNYLIRQKCGQIAAYRWAERFLKAGQGLYSTQEYAALLALVALHHPELEAAARAEAPTHEFEGAKARVKKEGGPFALFEPL